MKRTFAILFVVALLAGCQSLPKPYKSRLNKAYLNSLMADANEPLSPPDRLLIAKLEALAAAARENPSDDLSKRSYYNVDDSDDDDLQIDAYGPGVHMNRYGQPVRLRPDFGGVYGERLQIKRDAYGPGVHMDQYGRPVREYPR